METIEGRNPVTEALRAGRPINKILLSNNIRRHGVTEIMNLARQSGIPLEFIQEQALLKYSTTGNSQGIIAITAVSDSTSASCSCRAKSHSVTYACSHRDGNPILEHS